MLLGECPLDQLELGQVVLAKSFYQLLIQESPHSLISTDLLTEGITNVKGLGLVHPLRYILGHQSEMSAVPLASKESFYHYYLLTPRLIPLESCPTKASSKRTEDNFFFERILLSYLLLLLLTILLFSQREELVFQGESPRRVHALDSVLLMDFPLSQFMSNWHLKEPGLSSRPYHLSVAASGARTGSLPLVRRKPEVGGIFHRQLFI